MWKVHCFRRLALLFSLSVAMLVAGAPAALAASDYELQTRETIGKLIQANALLVSGKTDDAQAVVLEMGQSIGTLTKIVQNYRQIANREHDRCEKQIGELDLRTNKLFVEQVETNRKIDDLTASITGAKTRGTLAQTEINRLNGVLSDTLQHMRDREARLQELQRWWWVIGYGQYLAIRTLVDNDIGNYDRTIKDFEDQNRALAQNQNALNQAQTLVGQLSAESKRANLLNEQLAEMRAVSQARLKGLNGVAVFLTDADVFWGLAQNLLEVNGDAFITKMKVIQSVLARDVNTPSLTSPGSSTAESFEKKLIEFADSLDKQSNFLLKDKTDFCGGSALPTDAAITPTRPCSNINQITAYYEIVDSKTCSFRYLNPPGCPPAAKGVDTSAVFLEQGRSRGTWARSSGQNWVGRSGTSPCAIAGAVYYGKLSGADQCEAACQSDAACTVWSFNTNNGFMPDSVNQCWGGPQALEPNKSNWGGFVSGGIH